MDMEYTENFQLKTKNFDGIIDSGINSKFSQDFGNSFLIHFKFATAHHKSDLSVVILSHNRSETLHIISQLKKVRDNHLTITGSSINTSFLVVRVKVHTQKSTYNIKLPIDDDKEDNTKAKEQDEKLEKEIKDNGRAGIVDNIKAKTDNDNHNFFSFNFKLVPCWNGDLDSDTWHCVMYPSDFNMLDGDMQDMLNEEQKECDASSLLSFSVIGHWANLNVKGNPKIFRVKDYDLTSYPKSEYNQIISNHIKTNRLKKNNLSIVMHFNKHAFNLKNTKSGVVLKAETPYKNAPKIKDNDILILETLLYYPSKLPLMMEPDLPRDKKKQNFLFDLSSFCIMAQSLLKSVHHFMSKLQITKSLQRLEENNIISSVNVSYLPKDAK